MTDLGELRLELPGIMEALVRHGDEEPRRGNGRQKLGKRRRGVATGVVGASPLTAVEPLVGDAVTLGSIPADDRLPHMVVREVRVLVVRRIEVDEVGVELRSELVCVDPRDRPGRAGDGLRQSQLEPAVRARGPRLEVGHLQARRAVDAVGGFEQRGEQHAPLDR